MSERAEQLTSMAASADGLREKALELGRRYLALKVLNNDQLTRELVKEPPFTIWLKDRGVRSEHWTGWPKYHKPEIAAAVGNAQLPTFLRAFYWLNLGLVYKYHQPVQAMQERGIVSDVMWGEPIKYIGLKLDSVAALEVQQPAEFFKLTQGYDYRIDHFGKASMAAIVTSAGLQGLGPELATAVAGQTLA